MEIASCKPLYAVLAALIGSILVSMSGRKPNFREGLSTVAAVIMFLIIASMVPDVLAGSSVNFMAFNRFLAPDPAIGQIFTLVIMAIAAAEAAIAVSIVVAVYRNYKSIDTEDLVDLHG